MFSKIDIFSIVVDHFATLKNYKTGKIYLPDLLVFFIVPLLLSILLVHFKVQVGKDFANAVLTCFSIFAGLLFNLLLLIFDIADKQSASRQDGVHPSFARLMLRIAY
jgi:hypothetical protein